MASAPLTGESDAANGKDFTALAMPIICNMLPACSPTYRAVVCAESAF